MSLIKSASTVSALTLGSRIAGLVRDQLFAAAFGANALTDAFHVAFRIPNLFRRLFGEGAFSQAFVPILAEAKVAGGAPAAKPWIDDIATALVWVLLATSVVGVACAGWLTWAMAAGLQKDPQAWVAAVNMTRWMFPYIFFISLVSLASGILNTWRQFALPAATPILLNLCMIAAILWLGPWLQARGLEPIYGQAVAVMVGGALQLAVQVPALRKLGLLPRIGVTYGAVKAAFASEHTRRVTRLMVPALFGVGVAQVSLFINTQLASRMAAGSVTWLSNADRLMEFPTALIGVALGVVLMPRLSSARAAGEPERYSALMDWGLRVVVLLTVPATAALLVFAKPLVAVIFQYGAYSERDVLQTAAALAGWGVGLLGIVAIKVLAPGYFARQDMKTPALIALAVLVFTQVLNLFLVPVLQHAALTLTVAIGALANAAWLLWGLVRRGSYRPLPGWGAFLLQVLAAAALMTVFLLWAATAVPWTQMQGALLTRVGWMALAVLGGAAIYFVAALAAGLKWRDFLQRQ